MTGNFVLTTDLFYESFVLVGFISSHAMIKMKDTDPQIIFITKSQKDLKHRHGILSGRKTQDYAVSFFKKGFRAAEFGGFRDKGIVRHKDLQKKLDHSIVLVNYCFVEPILREETS